MKKHEFSATLLGQVWGFLVQLSDEIDKRNLFLMASGIAFNQLLCLIPLVLLIITTAGSMIGEEATKQAVRELFVRTLPQGVATEELLSKVIDEIRTVFNYSTVAGWVAAFGVLWTASALFRSMRTALNDVFDIPTPKVFLWYRLKDMLLTVLVVGLVMITTLVSPVLEILQQKLHTIVHQSLHSVMAFASAQLLSIMATTLLFIVLYRFVPNKRLSRRIVLYSTIIAVIGWEAARLLFTNYVGAATQMSTFYGGYVALAAVALWLYYAALVYLVAAEMAVLLTRRLGAQKGTPTLE
jgi:membrane protein